MFEAVGTLVTLHSEPLYIVRKVIISCLVEGVQMVDR